MMFQMDLMLSMSCIRIYLSPMVEDQDGGTQTICQNWELYRLNSVHYFVLIFILTLS